MPVTVQTIIDTVFAAVPGFDRTRTVDTLKTGRPDQPVRRVVVTFTATAAVLAQAAALHADLVITHEPTFYCHTDEAANLQDDELVAAKARFIAEHHLAVWRCHDSWHRVPGDGILTGVVRQLGWQSYQEAPQPWLFHLPPQSLDALAGELKNKLGIASLRVTGAPALPCHTAALSVGCAGWERQRTLLNHPGVDVLIVGEGREWETCEYVRDTTLLQRHRGLIVLGHANSEAAGMAWLADWLAQRLPDVTFTYVPAADPFRHV